MNKDCLLMTMVMTTTTMMMMMMIMMIIMIMMMIHGTKSDMLGRKLHSGTSKNKGRSRWTGASCFVLDVPLCNMRPSMSDFYHVTGLYKGAIRVSFLR